MSTDSSAPPTRARLDAIDGLRAFAALWVVLFHIRAFSHAKVDWVPGLDHLVRSGSTGVSLFLVLSGFCLYIPYTGGRESRFAFGNFMTRRCRRLLPAYLTTLAILLVATAAFGGHYGFEKMDGGSLFGQAISHITLTHQLVPGAFYGLNGAYWSLGLEWELYLTLPLLLWGVTRFGLARTVGFAVAVNVVYRLGLELAYRAGTVDEQSLLGSAVLPNLFLGRWAEFAFGMVAAELHHRGEAKVWARRMLPVMVVLIPVGLLANDSPLSHIVFGGVFFGLVCMVLDHGSVANKVFGWRPAVVLGTMSYSIYLVHTTVLQVAADLLGDGASPQQLLLRLVATLPVVLLAAWVLFVTVERRTMTAPAAGTPGASLLFLTRRQPRPATEGAA